MTTTLVIMAAGIGYRFGGEIEQFAPVGLNKEDKEYVVKSFAKLIEDGVYQKQLFEDLK